MQKLILFEFANCKIKSNINPFMQNLSIVKVQCTCIANIFFPWQQSLQIYLTILFDKFSIYFQVKIYPYVRGFSNISKSWLCTVLGQKYFSNSTLSSLTVFADSTTVIEKHLDWFPLTTDPYVLSTDSSTELEINKNDCRSVCVTILTCNYKYET